ncbi:MAG TPA: pyridoxamine 5'-phosphate oxidase family protein [Solirubrobacteraceae bacterium]|jgi:PPOX class probable F420-dependent enzyme|nr:pyridoxamine 5'-phosphate oxidase family protein [Solirubrobacteraceae bacterium]
MSDAEMAEFLAGQRVVVVATNGAGGWPHLMPLWYVIRDGEIWAWTYAKSQKVKNLERDPRATLQIESGEQYHELRGVMVEANTVVHRELDAVSQLGSEIFARYSGGEAGPDALDVIRAQAAKRVGLQFVPQRMASWDHGKLAGVY